jgi:transcriptional regulator with XRE-family HTH domain
LRARKFLRRARAIGADRETVSRWRSETAVAVGVKPEYFRKLLEVLKCTADQLFASDAEIKKQQRLDARNGHDLAAVVREAAKFIRERENDDLADRLESILLPKRIDDRRRGADGRPQ